jgi:hypothetical protein
LAFCTLELLRRYGRQRRSKAEGQDTPAEPVLVDSHGHAAAH